MTDALVPNAAVLVDVFEDQIFSIFGAIRDAGFDGHIEGPEWAKLDNGKDAARIIINGINTTSLIPWQVEFSMIREIEDDTVTLFVRPFTAEWRLSGQKLTYFQLYTTIVHETMRAINTFAAPLSLYTEMFDDEEKPPNVALFPPEKSFLEPPA